VDLSERSLEQRGESFLQLDAQPVRTGDFDLLDWVSSTMTVITDSLRTCTVSSFFRGTSFRTGAP